jgi:hypothetical protein
VLLTNLLHLLIRAIGGVLILHIPFPFAAVQSADAIPTVQAYPARLGIRLLRTMGDINHFVFYLKKYILPIFRLQRYKNISNNDRLAIV